jgi:acyl carrier protein
MIENKIRSFIADNFLFREDRSEFPDTESLLEAGLIDSTGVLELVAFLESEFRIQMADDDIVPENLDSIARIVTFVTRKSTAMAAA